MKPPKFDYYRPTSLSEALDLLAQTGGEAKILAGGQSLVPLLNMRLASPTVLIDINHIPELADVRVEEDSLSLGALVRHRTLEESVTVREMCPLLSEAARHVGHVQIRNRGTLGGTLVHADPSAELPAAVAALGGTIVLASRAGLRKVPAAEFFMGPFMAALEPNEMLVEVHVPIVEGRHGWAFLEVARRHGDFALCGVAVQIQLDDTDRVAQVWIGLTGVDQTPVVPKEAAALLTGKQPTEAIIAEVADAVRNSCEPESDLHGTAEYRRHLAGVLTRRALHKALSRANAGGENR